MHAMNRADVIARLREHEAELKQRGVQHLYLFGSTAREKARENSDVDLFFDYERGTFSRRHNAGQPASASPGTNRGKRVARVLMPRRSANTHLIDITEALERIRVVMGDTPLDAFEQDWRAG